MTLTLGVRSIRTIWCRPEWMFPGFLKASLGARKRMMRSSMVARPWACPTSIRGANLGGPEKTLFLAEVGS